jgi:PTS system nitrogen regulatory IIA component
MSTPSAYDGIWLRLKATSKKQALQDLAERAGALMGLQPRIVADALVERERLGTTALGGGVAVPHARLAGLDRVWTFFARFEPGLPFDAADDQPVDIMVLLLTPDDAGADHLKALARSSRVLRQADVVARLRAATSVDALEAVVLRALAD